MGSVTVKKKLGVRSVVEPPWTGPPVIFAPGGMVSAVKLLNFQ